MIRHAMTTRSRLLAVGLLALLLLLLLPGGQPVAAQEGGIRCTTPTAQPLLTTGQSVFFSAEPRSTESGGVIYFWSTGDLEGNGSNGDGNIELFRSQIIFSADGTVTRTFKQITRSTGSILGGFNLAPAVSADGRFLTFFSDRHYPGSGFDNRDGNFEIFVADVGDLNNIQIRQITNTTQGSNLYPSISDDGMRVAFISDNPLDPATAGEVDDELRNLDIYTVDISGATPVYRQITRTALGVFNEAPSLSGDGSTLVFASGQSYTDPTTGATVNPEGNQEIFRYVVATGRMSAVTSTPGGVHEMPSISGNGSRIAFVSDQRLDPNVNIVGGRQIFLTPHPATGNGFFQISDTVGADNFDPDISADGNRIIYQRRDSGSSQQVVLYDGIAGSRQVFRSRTNPASGELGKPILSGNGTILFYEDEGGISVVECSISDLGLTASVSQADVVAGGTLTYIWTVSNLDQAVAGDVQVQAGLPSGITASAIAPPGLCSQAGQTITCSINRLEIGQSRTVTVTASVGPEALGALTTQVNASSLKTVDRNPANNSASLETRVDAQADLGIVKRAAPDTALNGEEITYTLSISNTGPSLARNVRVTDTLPAGLVFVSSPTCALSGGQVLCALGNMAPGAAVTATIRTRVTSFDELEIVNVAQVGGEQITDPAPLNNSVTITNSVNTKFDLEVSGVAEPGLPIAGGLVTYAYRVTNLGPSVADSVELSVTLPAALSLIGAPQPPAGGTCSSGPLFTCALGSLPRTQTATVIVTGTISPTVSGPIISLASVRSTTEANADRNAANDNATVSSTVVQQADLVSAVTAGAADVVAGTTMTYSLLLTNAGPSVASGTILTSSLPAGVTLAGLSTNLGTCSGSLSVSCVFGALFPGQQAQVTVTVQVNVSALGSLTNTLSASSTVLDPNTTNDAAVAVTLVTDQADLRLAKSASLTAAIAGQDSFFYTVAVGNQGPSLARSVRVTETLAAGLNFTGFGGPTGTACTNAGGGVIGCTLPNATPGLTQTLRIDVAASAAASGVLTSSAQVTSSALDPNPANNAGSFVLTAGQSSDLQVTKRAVINNLNVGGTVTYTVNVDNFGPSNASGVVISDILPVALTGPSVSAVQGSYSLASGLWTVGTIAAGQKLTLTVAGGIGSAASGQVITNTAVVHAAEQTDPQPLNNGQFVTFTVPLNTDLAVTQSVSSQTPTVQSIVTIVLTAINNGPETATGTQVNIPLPSALSYVSHVVGSGIYSPTTGLWTPAPMPSGSSAGLTISARVVGSGNFTSTATISGAQYDNNLTNNVSAVGLTVAPAADLVLTQAVQPAAPNVGDTLFFTLTLSNQGPDTTSGVQVQSLAPGSGGVIPSAGSSYSSTTNLWTIPVMVSGDVATLVMTRSVAVSGVITATAQVMASSLIDPDSTPTNGVGNGEDDQVSASLTVPAAADLELQLNASGGQFVGQDVLLQIQVTNRGPDVATNIVISEVLPAELTYSTHVVVGGGSYSPATRLWTIPSLGVGSFSILNITARVGSGAAGRTVTDQIESVVLDQYDPGRFPNTAGVSFLVGGADLALSKVVDKSAADVGSRVVYTVTVVNNGPTATTNVRITDTLPISLTGLVSAASAGTFGPNTPGASALWTIPSLAVSASETLVLTGTVIPGTANQIITNTISGASSDVADGSSANNTAAVSFRATAADLVLQKSATVTQPVEGESFFYFLNITNSGPDVATNVIVTDTVAQGITVTVAGAGYNLATGRWDVGTLAAGGSRTLLLTVNPIVGVSGGLVIVDPIDGVAASQEDPNPAINASVTITVTGADLALSKSAGNLTPDAGTSIVFSLGLTNTGPLPAGQVVVTDALPAGLTVVGTPTVTSGSVQVDAVNRLITWTHTSLVVGASAQLQMTTTVGGATGGQSLVNRAGIAGVQGQSGGTLPDANQANNNPSVTIVPQTGDLTVGIVAVPNPVSAGAPLLYTTIVTNSGPTAVANFTLTNTLPAGVTVQSASPGCTVTYPTVVCVRSTSLGVNATGSYTISVTSSVLTTLVHTAIVSTSTPEVSQANNSASQSTTVDPAGAVKLILTGAATQTAGTTQNLTITAKDSFGNTAATYTGDKTLTFSGAANGPNGASPSVTDKNGTARNFGVATTVTFVNGVATVSGGNNGALALVKVETAIVSVTDGVISTSGGDRLTVAVSAGPAAQLVLTGSANQTAGATQSLTIAARDSFGNPALAYTGDQTLSFSGAANAPSGASPSVTDKNGTARNFGVATTIAFVNGTATVSGGNNGSLTLVKVETATVAVSDTVNFVGSSGSGNLSVTVAAAAAHNLVFTTQPSANGSAAVNLAQQPVVQIRDQFNNPTASTDSIGLTAFTNSGCTTAAGGVLNGAGPNAASGGVANFSGVNYNLTGTIHLKATDTTNGAVLAACSSAVTIAHGAANRLVVSVQPGGAGIGQALNPAPQVRVEDAHGNLVSSDSSSSINATIITGTGTFISSSTQVQLSNGLAIFSNLRLDTADTYNLRFSINTAGFTVDSAAFAVSAGVADKLRITGSGSQAAGSTQSLTITALDAANNVAAGYAGPKSLTFSFESGSVTAPDGVTNSTITDQTGAAQNIGASTTITFADGIATVSGSANGLLRMVRTGTFILQVTDGGLSATGSNRLTVNVTPGPAHNLIFSQQPSASATAGVAFAQQPVVQIRDQFHNPTTDGNTIGLTPFTDAGCSVAGGGTLNGGGGTAASAGVATFTGVNYTKAETIRLRASSDVLTAACSNPITVSPASAGGLGVVTQPANAVSGSDFGVQPQIEMQDIYGNRIISDSSSTITVSIASGPVSSFHPTSTLTTTVSSGLASFSNLRLDTAGSYTLNFATSAGPFTTTSASFTVTHGPVTQLVLVTQPGNAVAGQTFGSQPILQLRDAANNVISSDNSSTVSASILSGSGSFFVTSTLTVTVSGGVATFTNLRIDKVDPYVLRFSTSAGGFLIDSNTFNVNAGSAAKLAFSVQPTGSTAGSTFGVTVVTQDSVGNFSTTSLPGTVKISVTLTSGVGPLQGTTTGNTSTGSQSFLDLRIDAAETNKRLTATSDAGLAPAISTAFTVTHAAPANLVMGTVSTPQQAGVPFSVTLTARDSFNNTGTSFNGTVDFVTNAGEITPTTSAAFSSGVLTQALTVTLPGSNKLITATQTSGSITGSSNQFTVTTGPFARLQLLVPGETAAPSTFVGKSGAPTHQIAGVPFAVTVQAVDGAWNPITTVTDTVGIASSDGLAFLPPNAALSSGTANFNIYLQTPGSATLTAQDLTTTSIFSNTSPAIEVKRAFTITKTADPIEPTAGESITYTIIITRNSFADASSVRLTDTLPVTVTGIVSSTTGGLACSGTGPIVCTLASLSANASAGLTVIGMVSSLALHNEQLVNLAQVSADGMNAPESAQVTTIVQRSVALAISKSTNTAAVIAGRPISYTVRITNTGPSAAANLLLTDTLPGAVTNVTFAALGGLVCSGTGQITCGATTLDAGNSVTLTITGAVDAATTHGQVISNNASASANETAIAISTLVTSTVDTLADLSITKSKKEADTQVGAVVTYTLRITNTGPSYARSVFVTDTLPVGVAFSATVEIRPTNLFGAESVSGQTITWMTDTLPLIDSGYITFTGTITGTGTLTNSVFITSTTADSAPGNNSATVAGFTVAGAAMATSVADLWLDGGEADGAIPLGATEPLLLRVGNRGPATDTGPVLTIFGLGEGLVELRTSPPVVCPRAGDGFVCVLPPLAAGDEVEIAVTLPADVAAVVESVWQVDGARFDPNPENNRLSRRWVIGAPLWRFFLPLLDNQVDAERNRPEGSELYLPGVAKP